MADTYTQALKARLIEEDAYPDDWADRLNNDVLKIYDAGISGQVEVDIGSATTYALEAMQNGTLSDSHYFRLNFVGTPVSAVTVTIPASVTPSKHYLIDNQTGQALTVKYAATAGVTIQDGDAVHVYCDGTSVIADTRRPRYDITAAEIAAGVTQVDYSIPNHEALGYVNPKRYGLSESATGSVNYTAMVDSNAVADEAACGIGAPAGIYPYSPSARIEINQDFFGVGGFARFDCDTGSYTGVFFQQISSTKWRDLSILCVGSTKLGTGIRQMPTVTTDFTGYQTLERVFVFGFLKNLDVGNTFLNTYINVVSRFGQEGFWCSPDSSTGNGYVTTHLHIACQYADNDRNILYLSTLQSNSVIFIGGSNENPGASPAAFIKIRGLRFIEFYCEGSSTIDALEVTDCTATIDGIYLNGTGGISLGSGTEIVIRRSRSTTATDLLTGGDGTQTVSLDNCALPSSGNSLAYLHLTMTNTTINGVFYEEYFGPRSSATLTLTGCTTSPTGSMTYTVNNDEVIALIPVITGTSNANTCTLTGIPAAIRPATTQIIPANLYTDNGVGIIGVGQINTAGVFTLFNGINAAGFTAAGNKGINAAITIRWKLAA